MSGRDRSSEFSTGRTAAKEPVSPQEPAGEAMRGGQRHSDDDSTTDQAKQKAQEKAQQAKGMAEDKAQEVQKKADQQRERAASGMHQAADQIRERGDQLPGGEQTSQVAHQAADKVESAANYVEQTDVATMTSDVEQLVRDHPKEALIAGFAAGFLLGRTFRS